MYVLENADFVAKDLREDVEGNQDVYVFGFYAEDDSVEIYYPGLYESMDLKIADSHSRIFSRDAFNVAQTDGTYAVLDRPESIQYDTKAWFQPEFLDEVYAGKNPDIINYINSMRDMLGDRFNTNLPPERDEAPTKESMSNKVSEHEAPISQGITIQGMAEFAKKAVAEGWTREGDTPGDGGAR